MSTQTAQLMQECGLCHTHERGLECGWCGKDLPRNKNGSVSKVRRWCGPKCQQEFQRNHVWTFARDAALKRDEHTCVRCSAHMPPKPRAWNRRHRASLGHQQALSEWREETREFREKHGQLEVNHIHALKDQGKGYTFGCQHHLDNLETVCRPCHVDITKEQRAARKS